MSPTSPILYAGRADERIVEGRAERSGETYYTVPGAALVSTLTTAPDPNVDHYMGWIARTPIVIDQLAFEVTTLQAGNARVGFYRATRDFQPFGAPLADSGDISVNTTGVKTYTPSTPVPVRPGRYVSVYNSNVSPTLRVVVGGGPAIQDTLGSAGSALLFYARKSRALAAFPTNPAAWDDESTGSSGWGHLIVYRLSQP